MKQNIYDHPDFFAGYTSLRERKAGLNDVLEQPAMKSLLPAVAGKRVLDLGCGAGGLCQALRAQGASEVVGVDLSARMLALAKAVPHEGITYVNQAIEDFISPANSFDLVVSSLAMHYVRDWDQLMSRVAGWLCKGGYFIFSIEHPIATAAQGIHPGWIRDADGNKVYWALDCYHDEGLRESRWIVDGVMKYHRTMTTVLNTLIEHGFTICRVLEPYAEASAEAERPELLEERRRPPFLCVKARWEGMAGAIHASE